MDWFTWISKTNLDPSLAYNYALTFTHNELEEDDIVHFSHEFLQSMGISIAKHRLEILKLARNQKARKIHLILRLTYAIKQTKDYIAKHIQAIIRRENSSLYLVPKRNYSLRWKVARLQRSKNLRAAKSERPMLRNDRMLMLTNGSPMAENRSSGSTGSSNWAESEANLQPGDAMANPWNSSFSSTMVHSLDGEYWSSSADEIKWDSMFQNLKPT